MASSISARTRRRAELIKALAHPSRLAIAESLQDGERCVCDLHSLVGADLSTVSKHLSVLKRAGIVATEKRGLNVYYSLTCACLLGFLECVDSLTPVKRPRRTALTNP